MSKGKKGHYIHVSGSGIMHDGPNGYGNLSTKIYSDVADVLEITSFDSTHVHRDIDAAVIEAGIQFGVPTAIVSPVAIYGVGNDPVKARSLQIPFLTEGILKRGKAFTVGEGNHIWDSNRTVFNQYYLVVTNIYIRHPHHRSCRGLQSPHWRSTQPNGGAAAWGREGYYVTQAAEHTWVNVVKSIANIAHASGA